MTEYNEGDLIEAVKGEAAVRGLLEPYKFARGLGVAGLGWPLSSLQRDGFTITVIEKAAPKVVLPTEPGIYMDRVGDVWDFDNSKWKYLGDESEPLVTENWAPFTRLAPVPETAKKVLNRVRFYLSMPSDGRRPNGEFMIRTEYISAIETEFGVTS